jgi:hypothetical protein
MNKRDRRIKKTSAKVERLHASDIRGYLDCRLNTRRNFGRRYFKIMRHLDKAEDVLRAITPPKPGEIRMGRCDYSGGAPRGYTCNRCRAHGVKLWRDYNTFLNHQELMCAACLQQHAASKGYAGEVNERGRWATRPGEGYSSDSFCWRVPAVPTADGRTFWGYSSVPPEGCTWWDRLPVRQPDPSQ